MDQLRDALSKGLTESSKSQLKKQERARRESLTKLTRHINQPYRPVRLTKDGILTIRRRKDQS